jgi:hypothetical protein
VPLSRYLGKAHRIEERLVLAVLDEAPELVRVGSMIRPRPPAPKQSAPQTRPAVTWPKVTKDLEFFLSELETDTVYVDVASARGGVVLRMRLDFVRAGGRNAIWLACLIKGRTMLEELRAERPLVLSQNWSLPLVRPRPDLLPPQIAVWRTTSASKAANAVRAALETRLGLAADRIRLTRDVCTPIELDRRVTGQATIRRLRQSRPRRDFASRACDRCGQPLSDPQSVRLGIGPECRKYYSRIVLDAVRRPGAEVERPGTKSQKAWLSSVRDAWIALM